MVQYYPILSYPIMPCQTARHRGVFHILFLSFALLCSLASLSPRTRQCSTVQYSPCALSHTTHPPSLTLLPLPPPRLPFSFKAEYNTFSNTIAYTEDSIQSNVLTQSATVLYVVLCLFFYNERQTDKTDRQDRQDRQRVNVFAQ
jgi:hypothetical protein